MLFLPLVKTGTSVTCISIVAASVPSADWPTLTTATLAVGVALAEALAVAVEVTRSWASAPNAWSTARVPSAPAASGEPRKRGVGKRGVGKRGRDRQHAA